MHKDRSLVVRHPGVPRVRGGDCLPMHQPHVPRSPAVTVLSFASNASRTRRPRDAEDMTSLSRR